MHLTLHFSTLPNSTCAAAAAAAPPSSPSVSVSLCDVTVPKKELEIN